MSDQCDALCASITVLSHILVGDSTLEETLRRVAHLANDTISGSELVSVALLVEGRPRTVAFTDITAPEIDDAQYHTGTGPCLDALRRQQVQRVDSTGNDERWPPFSEAAAAHGVMSSLCLPLVARHAAIGALNCYSRRPAAFSVDDERIGLAFAAAATVAVANAQAYWDARHRSEGLALAMASRATIEQAKGILIAEQHCNADEAFEMLVWVSQRDNRKLRDIADQIVKRCCRSIEIVGVHPQPWLTDLTNPDQWRATPRRAQGSAPHSRSGPSSPRGLQVGLAARRTAPSGPLRSG